MRVFDGEVKVECVVWMWYCLDEGFGFVGGDFVGFVEWVLCNFGRYFDEVVCCVDECLDVFGVFVYEFEEFDEFL